MFSQASVILFKGGGVYAACTGEDTLTEKFPSQLQPFVIIVFISLNKATIIPYAVYVHRRCFY